MDEIKNPTRITNRPRRFNFFITDNVIFDDGTVAEIGPHAFTLYSYLLRKANQEAVTWPSQKTMSKATGMSVRKVGYCLNLLQTRGMVRRDGWNGSTREIEVINGLERSAPDAEVSTTCRPPSAQDAGPSAPRAEVVSTTCRPPSAPRADKEYTVHQDTVIKTQHQDTTSADPKNGSSIEVPDLLLEADQPTLNQRIWSAFDTAYRRRYGVSPVRNGTVNSQIAQLGKRIGLEAPSIAEFYLRHNASIYVRAKHTMGLLLRDCEGMRTEWATGRIVTETAARQADRKQGNLSAYDEVCARRAQAGAA